MTPVEPRAAASCWQATDRPATGIKVHPLHTCIVWFACLLACPPALPRRNYSCIQGEPSVADIMAGAALPSSICKCEDAAYCAVVAVGSYSVPGQVGGWVGGKAGK